MFVQASLHEHTFPLYSLWDDAPDDGLVVVRNMYSQLMDNKDYSWEVLHLFDLSTHWNMMHGTYSVKLRHWFVPWNGFQYYITYWSAYIHIISYSFWLAFYIAEIREEV